MAERESDVGIGHLLTCPKCGRSNPQGTRYCESCGARLTDEAVAVAEPKEEKKQGFFARLFRREDRAA